MFEKTSSNCHHKGLYRVAVNVLRSSYYNVVYNRVSLPLYRKSSSLTKTRFNISPCYKLGLPTTRLPIAMCHARRSMRPPRPPREGPQGRRGCIFPGLGPLTRRISGVIMIQGMWAIVFGLFRHLYRVEEKRRRMANQKGNERETVISRAS